MSLKNIILKTAAASVAVSIVFCNCSIFGLGLSKAIAENIQAPSIEANFVGEKYVQYKNQEYAGVAMQSKVSVGSNRQKNNYLPTKSVELEVSLPKLNNCLPQKVVVAKSATQATTGEKENTNVNQNYDSNSGLLTVSYNNEEDNNGNIYSEYKEGTKDEFEIIYIYPAEAYTENQEEIKLNYAVKAQMTFKTENGEVISTTSKNFEISEKENKGDISEFSVAELKENVYKGYMYSNVENQTEYNTNYTTVSTLSVLNSQVVNEMVMNINDSKFVLNNEDETEVSANENIVIKSTKISKTDFNKILGQDGVIEIYNADKLLATVKYIEQEENKKIVKKLAVIYSDENIQVLNNEDTDATINYSEDVTNLKIKISKPISEGFVNFENQYTIKSVNDYKVNVSDINYIRNVNSINNLEKKVDIKLLEPQTKINIESSNLNFSTLQNSKTTLTVKLDDTNAATTLFENPILTIKLPEGITNGNLSSPEILNGNGLKIKSTKVENNIITIWLEGKQTSYDINNVSGGTSLIMDIENISYKNTLPTHQDKIELTCVQNAKETKTNCNVNIVSKAGLLMLSKTTGYDNNNSVATSIDSSLKQIELSQNDKSKQVSQTISLVNNYDQDLTEMQVIGRIGYTDQITYSTFDINLLEEIKVNKENVKIYYSENKNASYNDASWNEEFNKNAKLYKIVFGNFAKMDVLEISLKVQIPENLDYNQTSYLKTEANYKYNNQNITDLSIIKMSTEVNTLLNNNVSKEQTENLNVSVTPVLTQSYVHSGQTVTYRIRVANNSQNDLENVIVEDIIPNNTLYTYQQEKEGNIANYLETIKDENTKIKVFEPVTLKAGEIKEFEVMLIAQDVITEQEMKNIVNVRYNSQIIKTENVLKIKPQVLKTTLKTSSDTMINVEYSENSILEFQLSVVNTTESKMKNAKVQYVIPEFLTYKEGGMAEYDQFDGYLIKEQGTVKNNIFEYNIDQLKPSQLKTIVIRCRVNKLTNGIYEKNIDNIAKVILENDIYETNLKTIKTVQSDFTILLNSNVKENQTLKSGDTIEYTVIVKNIGKRGQGFNIYDSIPEQIDVNEIEYATNLEEPYKISTGSQNIDIYNSLEPSETLILKIRGTIKNAQENEQILNIANSAKIAVGEYEKVSNTVNNSIKLEYKEGYTEEFIDILLDEELPKLTLSEEYLQEMRELDLQINQNAEDNIDTNVEQNNKEQKVLYTISGVAWVDANKNGNKDESEKMQDSVIATLVNSKTGNFVKDAQGNKLTTTTNSNGEYKFENVEQGSYLVLFEFDTNTFIATTYQKENVEENLNSDAILTNLTVSGQKETAGITDAIILDSNKENIDIGLVERTKFDLSLNKQISKVIVVNSQGTKEIDYNNKNAVKFKLDNKYLDSTSLIITYKYLVTNTGDTAGYVNSISDELPTGLEFSSDLNKNWYKGADGKIYATALSGTLIKPGETTYIELVLTKKMTEASNKKEKLTSNATLEKTSNLENIQEQTTTAQNNQCLSSFEISVKDNTAIIYVLVTISCLIVIGISGYFIKKKILNKGI